MFVCLFFERGSCECLLTFPTYRVGSYWRWALISGWALNQINMVIKIWVKSMSSEGSNF